MIRYFCRLYWATTIHVKTASQSGSKQALLYTLLRCCCSRSYSNIGSREDAPPDSPNSQHYNVYVRKHEKSASVKLRDNGALRPFRVIQGPSKLVPVDSPNATSYYWLIIIWTIFSTVSEILRRKLQKSVFFYKLQSFSANSTRDHCKFMHDLYISEIYRPSVNEG